MPAGFRDAFAAPVGDFLTPVDGDRTALGRRSIELLLERLDGRTESVLDVIAPRLITRNSTRAFSAPPKEAS